jgi:hypothetical protein
MRCPTASILARVLGIPLLAVALPACNSDTGTDPSDDTTTGCFAITGNKGSVAATISGLPAFSGTVPTGQATYTPAAAPVPALFNVQATNITTGTTVLVGGPGILGTTTAAPGSAAGSSVQLLVTTRTCAGVTGSWIANSMFGTASVTLTTASTTAVAGSFTGTLEAASGSGATGTKTMTGTFNVTF